MSHLPPDLLIPVLVNEGVSLRKMFINCTMGGFFYMIGEHVDFHKALSQQPGLRILYLLLDMLQLRGVQDHLDMLVDVI